MALVKCPDCDRDVSSETPACPVCGRLIKSDISPIAFTASAVPPVSLQRVINPAQAAEKVWNLSHPIAGNSQSAEPALKEESRREVSRQEAHAIADAVIRADGLGTGVQTVLSLEEIQGRRPVFYSMPDLAKCWIVYVEREPIGGVAESVIVVIAKDRGEVLYRGRAGDEG